MHEQAIPAGLCQCGCGENAPISRYTHAARGYIKGQPRRFIYGHGRRTAGIFATHRALWTERGVDYGLCLCGCGQRTDIAETTQVARHWIAGEPKRFISRSHAQWKSPVEYLIEDRGYATPCWIWQRGISNGYGHQAEGLAHIVNYKRAHGSVPMGLELDHLCRVKACVNPDHLEAVTHTENVRRGPQIKLSLAQANEIRKKCANGATKASLGREYGVSSPTIGAIVNLEVWRS